MNNKPFYVAIDSDVLRHLAYLDVLQKSFERIDVQKINDTLLQKDFNYYFRLFEHVKNDDVRILIVDAVYNESKYATGLVNFMKEYCYFPNINAVNYQLKSEKARALANAYCSPYEIDGKKLNPPMKFMFVADINKNVPTNDAYIMAQATVENCCLLTGNKKDFIFDKKNNDDNKDRLDGICKVNILNGYFEENEYGVFTSKPITLNLLVGRLKRNGILGIAEQEDNKIKGDLILK